MTIDWNSFTPTASLGGGLMIGLAAALLILFNGRIAGISGILGGLLRPATGDVWWRVAFLSGLLISPLAYSLFAPLPAVIIEVDTGLLVAAKTWRYFEAFVTEEHNFLPPDNVQFDPEPRVAHRTSPTNIAMSLLATLSAHDLEFIDTNSLIERLEGTLATLDRLEHFEGHLLNWYDTRTLAPLLPSRYMK